MSKFLIVDDEPLICKGVSKLICRVAPNWELCAEAWDGKEGIEKVIQYQPDLIFSDIRMPEMDGLTMANQLIDQAISVPIVFLTGYDEFAYTQKAIKNKAFDYLLKPINEADLRQVFGRYQREYNVETHLEQEEATVLRQYEFFLENTIESQNISNFNSLSDWYNKLEKFISIRSFIYITTSAFNSHLLKYNIIGVDYKPIINETNIINVIQKLQEYCVLNVDKLKAYNKNRLIEKVEKWVESNIQENISLTEVANVVHLNATYFSEYFKKCKGETFSQYLVRCRMEKAKELLSDHSLRVYEVASNVGYSDNRHFSKVFQSKVGMTPTEYRKNVLGLG
ncbi:response regulator transcription factor [Gracilibacillus sp. D59]|uniref:response regulator transcription factor n=1 Tax=Gracilibacillus sp. D59 TaxID=3457434 RepID=UPI003FCDBADC